MAVSENIANLRGALQSAQGAAASASQFGMYLAGGSMPAAMGTDGTFEETTGVRIRSDRYVSERHIEGAPEFFVMPQSIGYLFYGALGAKSVTGAGDPYAHVFIPATSRPWFTFWRSQGALIYEELRDCKIDSLVITGTSGQPLRVTANIQGLDPRYESAAETTAGIEVTNRFLYYDGQGALSLEGSAVASIREFTLTISNNGELIPGDALTPIDVSEGELTIQLAVTKLFLAPSLRNRKYYGSATPADDTAVVKDVLALGGTPNVRFLFTRVAAAPGPERSLQIDLSKCYLAPYDVQPGTGSTPLTEALTLDAVQPAAGNAIDVTLKNGLAAYAP